MTACQPRIGVVKQALMRVAGHTSWRSNEIRVSAPIPHASTSPRSRRAKARSGAAAGLRFIVKAAVIKNARNYETRFALTPAGQPQGLWQDGGLNSKARNMPIAPLIP